MARLTREVIAWALLVMLSTVATIGDLIEINAEIARLHSTSIPHHSRPVVAQGAN